MPVLKRGSDPRTDVILGKLPSGVGYTRLPLTNFGNKAGSVNGRLSRMKRFLSITNFLPSMNE